MGKTNDRFTISHFECSTQKCSDLRAGAQWVWKCLENLAAVFCEYYCCRPICNMPEGTIEKLTKYRRATSEQEGQEQWEDAQRQFHEAMAYFPEYAKLIETCPACAVAESFSCFPLIVRHSPRSPVATSKVKATDLHPRVVSYSNDRPASLPCVIIETSTADSETQTEERLRESALIALRPSDLPPMPMTELEEIENRLIPGQRIARNLNLSRHNAPTKEDLNQFIVTRRVTSAIVCVVSLRELIRIVYYHPGAIDEGRAQVLHEELVQSLEGAMAHDDVSAVRLFYTRPKYGDRSAEIGLGEVLEMLVLQHLQTTPGDGSPEHIERAAFEILRECTEIVPQYIMEIVAEVRYARLHKCRIPRPVDDPSFSEKGRFVEMIGHYWSLCKKVIVYQLGAKIYDPDMISHLMDNLRKMIDAYFAELGSLEGVTDAQEAVSALMETCTSPNWRDLQSVSKQTQEMIHKIDVFLKSANAALRKREYPLISEERMFIEHSNREIDEFHAFISKKWKAMPADAETIGNQGARKTDVMIPGPAEEYPKDKLVLERKDVDERVHWFVNGVDKGPFFLRSSANKAKIIEALYNQIGLGWVPHITFMNACGWEEQVYFPSSDNPGRMQRQLTHIRNFLDVKIEFCKDKGVRLAENVVKSK